MAQNNILVTGANGFLGRAILSRLQMSDVHVNATDLGASNGLSGIVYRKANITRAEELKPVLESVTTVIHAAGLAHVFSSDKNLAKKFRQINEIGTANVAAAAVAAGVEHFILISSVSVYGPCTQGVYDENTPCSPVGPYALSKYNAEQNAIKITQKSRMALTILRLATLYGEGDPGNVGRLIKALDRRHFLWIGDGSNQKSLLYKGDAARACLAVAERPVAGVNIFNLSAPSCTMREIVDCISNALGKHPLPLQVPAPLALYLSRYLYKIPNHRVSRLHQAVKKWLAEDIYDTRRFERIYDFHTQTSLKDGLKREVDWYRQKNSSLGR
jgi:nucleoside-diphosphate-sugar epimerase